MPYIIQKVSHNKYAVRNAITGKYHTYGSSLDRAKAQVRLLHMLKRR